jgi:hypothetical protein
MRWAAYIARNGEMRNLHQILVEMPEGKKPLESPRRRWVDNITMDLREIVREGVDWIHLARDRGK